MTVVEVTEKIDHRSTFIHLVDAFLSKDFWQLPWELNPSHRTADLDVCQVPCSIVLRNRNVSERQKSLNLGWDTIWSATMCEIELA